MHANLSVPTKVINASEFFLYLDKPKLSGREAAAYLFKSMKKNEVTKYRAEDVEKLTQYQWLLEPAMQTEWGTLANAFLVHQQSEAGDKTAGLKAVEAQLHGAAQRSSETAASSSTQPTQLKKRKTAAEAVLEKYLRV